MPKRYWLVKSEPDCFSWDDLWSSPKRTTHWDGVRNYQARNNLRGMKVGELAKDFTLPDTDGAEQQLLVGAPATAIVFTCNHCPYALAWHDRLVGSSA